jgi:aryl-alcohol dehydrogenase-like predicted oxidoreductase
MERAMIRLSRRESLMLGAGAALASMPAWAADKPLLKRRIPHSGEMIPVVGLGTANGFDASARADLETVIRTLLEQGGTAIDTAPSYGNAESVIGEILAAENARAKTFVSTKLEDYRPGGVAGEAQGCLTRLKTNKLDLLHLHNVRDSKQSLAELNALKAKGLIRYHGITTTFERAYDAAEAIVKREKPDFLEVDYAIDNREAENRLLPAALDSGAAVMVALPFGRGRLFRDVLKKPLPDFAAEIDCASWAQFFLKFILGHPAVTVAIPGTSNPAHMIDNIAGGRGAVPDAKMRERMVQYVSSI